MTTGITPMPVSDAVFARKRGIFRRLLSNPLTAASFAVLAIFALVALFQPWLVPFPPAQVRLALTNAPPFTTEYILGGDKYGRDILSRVIASTRGAFVAAAVLSLVAFIIGTTAGLVAGYFGKLADSVSSAVFSIIMAVPGIILLISLYTVLGTSTIVAMAVLGVLVSPTMFWMVRTLTRNVRNELYVDAARVAGLSDARIVARHVLIAIRAPVILVAAGLAGAGIAAQAGLEFLGLGDPSAPSWGSMMTEAFTNFYIAPEQLIWPAAALALVTGAFSLISIGVRDTLEGTYVKPSKRSRSREIEALLGRPTAAVRTGTGTETRQEEATTLATHPPGSTAESSLLAIEDLQIAYSVNGSLITVVDGASLQINSGEVVGIVGESGSGKTQTVFAAMGLLPEEAIVAGGSIKFAGRELLGLSEEGMRRIRGRQIAYVPQEPMSNLDSAFTIGSQLMYGIRAQSNLTRRAARALALQMLDRVGIREPERVFRSYPHQISGGMAQRVLIAGAVACRPPLLIADEPTTALDVTIQAEVLDLLRALQAEMHMAVIIVTHNFGVVADLCDRVIVMRSGRIVEHAGVHDVFDQPQHEYTKVLLGSVLDQAPARGARRTGVAADG